MNDRMNVLVLYPNKEKALQIIGGAEVAAKISPYFCEWTSKLYQWTAEGKWEEAVPTNLRFELVMRHGSDALIYPKDISIASNAKWLVFGGGGSAYPSQKRVREGEYLILRPLFENAALGVEEWQAMGDYFQGKTSSPPALIYSSDLEKSLQEKYAQLGDLDAVISKKGTVLITNDYMIKSDDKIGKIRLSNTTYEDAIKALSGEVAEIDQSGEEIPEFGEPELLIMPAELTLPENGRRPPLQDLQGTKLVRDLRLKGFTAPIILFSPHFSEEEIRQRDPYDVLAAPGQYFLKLPWQKEILEELMLEPLSDRLLAECNYYHFEAGGKFRELMHDLFAELRNREPGKPTKEILARYFSYFAFFYNTRKDRSKNKKLRQIECEMGRIIADNVTETGNRDMLSALRDQLQDLLVGPESKENSSPNEINWKILYVEDRQKDLERVTTALDKAGLPYIATGDSQEAIKYIREDTKHEIKVVLSDWRLKYANGKWQTLQGLDILEKIAYEEKREVAFFVLTDRTGAIFDEIKKRQRFIIHWYAKENVFRDPGAITAFCGDLMEEGETMQQIFLNKPAGASWFSERNKSRFVRPLREYYQAYYLAPDYEIEKAKVDAEALEIAMRVLDQKNHSNYRIPTYSIMKLTNPPGHPGEFQKFRAKLIHRRVYLGLLYLGYPHTDINDKFNIKGEKQPADLKTHLAIVEGIPPRDQCLWEELQWIESLEAIYKKHLGLY